MDSRVKELLEKQLELLFEQTRDQSCNRSCSKHEIAELSLAMAEIAKVIQFPIFAQAPQQSAQSLSGTAQAQTREQMHERILKASNTKILRRQLELLAEYSRLREGTDAIPKCSEVMVRIYRELIKTKCGAFGFIAMSGIALTYFLKRLFVKVT